MFSGSIDFFADLILSSSGKLSLPNSELYLDFAVSQNIVIELRNEKLACTFAMKKVINHAHTQKCLLPVRAQVKGQKEQSVGKSTLGTRIFF